MPGYYWFNHFLVLVDTPPRRGRLVEDQGRRVLQHRAGDREPLALSAGQLHASLTDERVESLRHRLDELQSVCSARGGDDCLGRCAGGSAIGDVRGDGIVEQDDVLADERNVGAYRIQCEIPQVDAVEPDLAVLRVVERS